MSSGENLNSSGLSFCPYFLPLPHNYGTVTYVFILLLVKAQYVPLPVFYQYFGYTIDLFDVLFYPHIRQRMCFFHIMMRGHGVRRLTKKRAVVLKTAALIFHRVSSSARASLLKFTTWLYHIPMKNAKENFQKFPIFIKLLKYFQFRRDLK